MSGPLNRHTYEQMIEEDIAALPESMPSLEREHIIAVLRDSVTRIYGKQPDTRNQPRKYGAGCGRFW